MFWQLNQIVVKSLCLPFFYFYNVIKYEELLSIKHMKETFLYLYTIRGVSWEVCHILKSITALGTPFMSNTIAVLNVFGGSLFV